MWLVELIYLVVELRLGQFLLLNIFRVVQDLRVLAVLGDELDERTDEGANGAAVARQDGLVLKDRRNLQKMGRVLEYLSPGAGELIGREAASSRLSLSKRE